MRSAFPPLLLMGALCLAASAAPAAETGSAALSQRPRKVALRPSFEANRGQAPGSVAFRTRDRGALVDFDPRGASFRVPGVPSAGGPALRLTVDGAAPARIEGAEPLAERTHYLVGPRERWVTGVPHFDRVRYREVYAGIDLEFYHRGDELEYDFVVAPGADPARIGLAFEGARQVSLLDDGSLHVAFAGGSLHQRAPLAYQVRADGSREVVTARQILDGRRVRFELGAYDPARPLVIDPILLFSGLIGGPGINAGRALAMDGDGFVYLAGQVEAASGIHDPVWPPSDATDAFVAKLDPLSGQIQYTAFFGGTLGDVARAIHVDSQDRAWVVGTTWSDDFPTSAGAPQETPGGGSDAFLARLTPDGQDVEFATYIGGSADDTAEGVGLDAADRPVVYGDTSSTDLPVVNALQPDFGGEIDGFVARYEAAGSPLIYLTYLGGSDEDNPVDTTSSLVVDAAGNAYVSGTTLSLDFPTANALQPKHGLGGRDGFISKIDPLGTGLVFSTYFGGGAGDSARGLALGPDGSIYVAGGTRSFYFPTVNPLQPRKSLIYDAFIARLTPDAQKILFSTYLGGSDRDMASSIAVDENGAAYVMGHTLSPDFPLRSPSQPAPGGSLDVFVAKITPTGSSVAWSTVIGGSGAEVLGSWDDDLVLTADHQVVVVGVTSSVDFPTVPEARPPAPYIQAFVATLSAAPEVALTLQSSGPGMAADVTISNPGPASRTVQVRAWADVPTLGAPFALAGTPTGPITLAPGATQVLISGLALDDWFAADPDARVGARLLDAPTGRILSERICEALPCE